jgi:hypothetical protein
VDYAIADQDLARVSPLMHAHVIPNGTYRFSDGEEPERGRMYAPPPANPYFSRSH